MNRQRLHLIAVILLSAAGFPLAAPASRAEPPPVAPRERFAVRLVEAARAQVSTLVVYTPAYTKLAYPGGDLPPGQGVCTDVVVRAYRALGHDLQKEIHESGIGSGDPNIDHRRVTVQRKYFARFGTPLPLPRNPSAEPLRFEPGDLVTYELPPGGSSTTHIAIVSDRKTPEGIPLVIHNRGLGVEEEDWLFGWKMTGHYRFEPRLR